MFEQQGPEKLKLQSVSHPSHSSQDSERSTNRMLDQLINNISKENLDSSLDNDHSEESLLPEAIEGEEYLNWKKEKKKILLKIKARSLSKYHVQGSEKADGRSLKLLPIPLMYWNTKEMRNTLKKKVRGKGFSFVMRLSSLAWTPLDYTIRVQSEGACKIYVSELRKEIEKA
ncbi:unnamed protein product [Lepeophtheirus salmonis]|uniref:(salmon louse) hypothetical protein n=1 Tax=Lepeophtheirus salmonis TaxID=72036 RepID=A0A7R8CFA0_LEPSM|nr:unnamed protein product [Lepeophtheirus salmonis]CAF2804603.1 unnamed protein product [Lepeophtheirus salmonis]